MTTRTVTSGEITDDEMRAYRAAKALHRDGGSPASVFGLLAAIVEDRTWERLVDNGGAPFPTFTAFVEAREPGGLGFSKAELVKILALRHPHEDSAPWDQRAEWLRKAAAGLLAAEVPPAAANGDIGNGRSRATGATQTSETAEAITSRLKRDDPELAARVVSGEVTANAAAREKGWRKPRIVLTSPASVAVRLRQHFSPDEITELRNLLNDDS